LINCVNRFFVHKYVWINDVVINVY
jgi:hypothetical protein